MSASGQASARLFDGLQPQEPDAVLSLIGLFQADPRADKLDLGVGVFRDLDGRTPVMGAVKAAEARLVAGQQTKVYLGPEGDVGFLEALMPLVVGDRSDRSIYAIQTPGGTGALWLAAKLIVAARPGARVLIGAPTWVNHAPIFRAAGLEVQSYRYLDIATQRLCFEDMLAALDGGRCGDVALLHGCCHNPTGADLSVEQWAAIADVVSRRGLTPLIDLAYQGLAEGFEADAEAVRQLLPAATDTLIAYSCDKNFGLYRERTGALFAASDSRARLDLMASNLRAIARTSWSMPPDHGAAAAHLVLEDSQLALEWRAELERMRRRLVDIREVTARAVPALGFLARQYGLFAQLPLSTGQVAALRSKHGVYLAGSGRINLAGLTPANVPQFAQAYTACIEEGPS